MNNKIYQIPIDAELHLRFKELQEGFVPGERIVSTNVHDKLMIVTTEVDTNQTKSGRPRNLLLEEIGKGQIPAAVLGLKK
jgi:hypothetical protein